MKTIRFTHPDYPLIVKADLEWENGTAVIKAIKFGLPTKASKLEKLLLKYVEIYCFDVLRNNMYNVVLESKEYNKFVGKQTDAVLRQAGVGKKRKVPAGEEQFF